MSELFKQSVKVQYEASLAMFVDALRQCDDDDWLKPVGVRAFWEVAYHNAVHAHLYLSASYEAFEGKPDWAGEFSGSLGIMPEPPYEPVDPGPPVDRLKTLAYTEAVHPKIHASLDAETEESLNGPSGFFWLGFSRAELYLYELRHLQHHTGQLCAVLRTAGKDVDWVGSGWPAGR